MADLTVEYHWLCKSNLVGSVKVKGSKGEVYEVEWVNGRGGYQHCTCKGFKFKGECKHVKQAISESCKWNAFWDVGKPVEVETDDDHPNGLACPKCGGEVTSMGWGV